MRNQRSSFGLLDMHRLAISTAVKGVVGLLACTIGLGQFASAQAYKVTNIISDGFVPATTVDANFINPWAASASPSFWISAQGTGFNYVATSAGVIPFKVIVPAASGLPTATGLPSGSVTTTGSAGMILPNGTKASFLFSTLDGTISGWNSKLGTANAIAQIVVNNSAAGASYAGLALLNTTTASYLLAPNFGGNAIEVYDSTFKLTKLAGSFVDPTLPAGYSPFSIHIIGNQIFVAYALRTATVPYRTVNAPGNGVVSVFDTTGTFVARVVTGGNLNSPWGVAFAPASFGIFSNDLLIGNFGDGMINVYDPKTFSFLGQLMDGAGKSLVYASLWELLPGGAAVGGTTTVGGGDTSTLYFTAGLKDEAHGLLGGITSTATAGSAPTFGLSASTGAAKVPAGGSTQATISVAPVNGFSGAVTLGCTGLPARTTCTFSPAQMTVTPTAGAIGTVTFQTASSSTAGLRLPLRGHVAGITSALLLPFASLLAFRRRRSVTGGLASIRLLGVMLLFTASIGLIAGCSTYAAPAVVLPATPSGASTITLTATAGTVTQQTSFALTVQ
jgi:uncharacterized protein (TIGR03118 family)